ncbi:MAG: DNA phosphorothioation system restriction enzyme, partial [Syntrophorhabdus sp.]
AAGLLEIKLALRLDKKGEFARGIFHEKTCIFTDEAGNHVAFSGSSNETAGGLLDNFESIKAFCSWKDNEGRVQEEIDNFEALWNNTTPGLKVMEFSAAGKALLERYRDPFNPPAGMTLVDKVAEPEPEYGFSLPTSVELREYQKEAIRSWSKADGKGIFAMATGSGKTLTALTLASKVAEKNRPMVLLVVCPFINLCRQWIKEISAFGLKAVGCFEGRDKWAQDLEEGYQWLSAGMSPVLAIVATNATFTSDSFQARILPRISSGIHHLFIADEVHNLGAELGRKSLPEGIAMRLGLSATPERHYDAEGTSAVLSYFGDIVYRYTLSDAIAAGHLCNYRYHPVTVSLTDQEAELYEELTVKLAKILAGKDRDAELEKSAMHLLIKRARLLGSAYNKLEALDQVIEAMKPERPRKAIFYCGDGRTTNAVTDEEMRQIVAVAKLLGDKHGLRVRNFTFRESPQEREEILRDLDSGFLDGVVAIRCLDEGIDLPDLRMGFLLASSTNPRQFVQRRGRLLRNSPGKNRAEIYDFIIRPPDLGGKLDDEQFNLERSFFQRELGRIVEFCRMAENGPEAMNLLRDLRLDYNLLAE